MKKWKLWTGVLLIFVAGICIGVVGTGLYVRHTVFSMLQEGSPAVARLVTKKLTRELDLNDSQQVVVKQSIKEMQRQLWEMRRRFRPEMEKIVSDGIDRVRPELTTAQQEKLDRLYARFKARWELQEKIHKKSP